MTLLKPGSPPRSDSPDPRDTDRPALKQNHARKPTAPCRIMLAMTSMDKRSMPHVLCSGLLGPVNLKQTGSMSRIRKARLFSRLFSYLFPLFGNLQRNPVRCTQDGTTTLQCVHSSFFHGSSSPTSCGQTVSAKPLPPSELGDERKFKGLTSNLHLNNHTKAVSPKAMGSLPHLSSSRDKVFTTTEEWPRSHRQGRAERSSSSCPSEMSSHREESGSLSSESHPVGSFLHKQRVAVKTMLKLAEKVLDALPIPPF